MPNWCENHLIISGPLTYKKEFDEKFKGQPANWENLSTIDTDKYTFNTFHPVPQEIIDQGFSTAGYNWCCNNWGTKWDACDIYGPEQIDEYEMEYYFLTAWSPATFWLRKAATLFPKLTFDLYYWEPGDDYCGQLHISPFDEWENDLSPQSPEGIKLIQDYFDDEYEPYTVESEEEYVR